MQSIAEPLDRPQTSAANLLTQDSLSEDMFAAVRTGQISRLRTLLAMGGNPDAKNAEGYGILLYAVKEKYEDAVEALLGSGANPNMKGPGGITSLMLAAAGGNFAVAKLLIANYVDISDINDGGEDAIAIARREGRYDLVALLEQQKNIESYNKQVAEKKKEIEKIEIERQRSSSFISSLSSNLSSKFMSAYDNVADKACRAKDYVKSVAKAFAAATARKSHAAVCLCSKFFSFKNMAGPEAEAAEDHVKPRSLEAPPSKPVAAPAPRPSSFF